MSTHAELNHGDLLLVLGSMVGVLEVEADELVLVLLEPLRVHVEYVAHFPGVVGVDHLQVLAVVDVDCARAGPVVLCCSSMSMATRRRETKIMRERRRREVWKPGCGANIETIGEGDGDIFHPH
jgi:hypothetical protein